MYNLYMHVTSQYCVAHAYEQLST